MSTGPNEPPSAPRSEGSPHQIEVSALTQEAPWAALAYWQSKCTKGRLPRHQDIDPSEIPRLLPFVTIIERLNEEPRDYFYRLEGEAVRQAVGVRRMGRRLSELARTLAGTFSLVYASFDRVCESGEPMAWAYFLDVAGRDFLRFESVLLPLSSDGVHVDRLFMCSGISSGPPDQALAATDHPSS